MPPLLLGPAPPLLWVPVHSSSRPALFIDLPHLPPVDVEGRQRPSDTAAGVGAHNTAKDKSTLSIRGACLVADRSATRERSGGTARKRGRSDCSWVA
jgi:hypothetical protein